MFLDTTVRQNEIFLKVLQNYMGHFEPLLWTRVKRQQEGKNFPKMFALFKVRFSRLKKFYCLEYLDFKTPV